MTVKRSQFGSLQDRMAAQDRELDGDRVRHVWLDATIPALVVDRRRTERGWEGRLVYVEDGRVVNRWVAAERVGVVKA